MLKVKNCPKVDQKFEKDQNVKSLFKIDQNIDSQKFVLFSNFDTLILPMP
jgi:hypothetical protein